MMRMNMMMAKAERVKMDPTLQDIFRNNIIDILGTDQMCYHENVKVRHTYKTQLGFEQIEKSKPLLAFMKENYDIDLDRFYEYDKHQQNESYKKLREDLLNMDPYMLF